MQLKVVEAEVVEVVVLTISVLGNDEHGLKELY